MKGPLNGFRVLEIGHMLAGPYCGLLLADLGADVIKIEPKEGDIARRVSPRSIGPYNEYFLSLNRNKRSVVLDLTSLEGQNSLRELAGTSHGLVTNLRPSVIRKLGLTYDALKEVNPKLVCVALTGFGLEGRHTERPAYDYVIQAMTGVMLITGEPDNPPTKTGYSAVDNSAGIMAALGMTAKLLQGEGGQVDVAMHDVMLSQLNYIASASLNSGVKAERHERSSHPYMVPAQIFETKSGWLVLFISHDKFWQRFCNEIGRTEWIQDARFATMTARNANRKLVVQAVADELSKEHATSWVERLVPLGIVASAVSTLEEALTSEISVDREMVIRIDTPTGTLRSVGNPIKTSRLHDKHTPPPLLGEHNAILGKGNTV